MNLLYEGQKEWVSRSFLPVLLLFSLTFTGCQKYLDKKPEKTAAVPSTLADLQALLDNPNVINSRSSGVPEAMADNYYVFSDRYNVIVIDPRNQLYVWNKDIDERFSWIDLYTGPIYYANTVIDLLPTINHSTAESASYNSLKGAALFYRAFAFYNAAQIYCKPYSSTASQDLGLCLKFTSNINEPVKRATVQESYDRIVADFKEAVNLLPVSVSVPTRPNKAAAYATLARVYLSMRDYVNAGSYANLALQEKDILMNYNDLVPVGSPPIPTFNAEVIYHNYTSSIDLIAGGNTTKVDSTLYNSYDVNDLRKTVFFLANTGANAGTYRFRGSYHGGNGPSGTFDGLTTDEMYLIRAECYAKAGNTTAALADLNKLLKNRYATGQFTDISVTTPQTALQKIREERRKELLFRNQRWSDLRRYNLEDSSITLKRIIDGTTYTLPPNDNRWVILVPWEEVNKWGLQQNPR